MFLGVPEMPLGAALSLMASLLCWPVLGSVIVLIVLVSRQTCNSTDSTGQVSRQTCFQIDVSYLFQNSQTIVSSQNCTVL